jgi:hypothetical protein
MPRPDDEFDSDRPGRRGRDEADFPRRDRHGEDDPDPPRRDRPRDDEYDQRPPPPRRKSGSKTLIIVLVTVFFALFVCGGLGLWGLMFSVSRIRESANRMKSSNNLKQTALAVHNFESANGYFPSNTYTADGKPLLSWRVHILPHFGDASLTALHARFKLDEPWDGPNNKLLLDQMPPAYQVPNATPSPRLTHYRGFSSPGAAFTYKHVQGRTPAVNERLGMVNFFDQTSNTLLAVEAADPIEWTKPDDLDASPGKAFPRLGTTPRYFLACMADGSVKTLRPDLPETTLRALVTFAGGEALPADWDAR